MRMGKNQIEESWASVTPGLWEVSSIMHTRMQMTYVHTSSHEETPTGHSGGNAIETMTMSVLAMFRQTHS